VKHTLSWSARSPWLAGLDPAERAASLIDTLWWCDLAQLPGAHFGKPSPDQVLNLSEVEWFGDEAIAASPVGRYASR